MKNQAKRGSGSRPDPGFAVIVGGDDVSYGSRPKDAKNWREKMLAEVGSQIDPTRTHFLGKLPYADYKRVLQVSSAHMYLTYPFILSWSCLEAMASGCLMVAWNTAPVREVLADGRGGCLVSAASVGGITAAIYGAMTEAPNSRNQLRQSARAWVQALNRARGRKDVEAQLGERGQSALASDMGRKHSTEHSPRNCGT